MHAHTCIIMAKKCFLKQKWLQDQLTYSAKISCKQLQIIIIFLSAIWFAKYFQWSINVYEVLDYKMRKYADW